MGKADFLLRTFPQFSAQDTTFKQIITVWIEHLLFTEFCLKLQMIVRFSNSPAFQGVINLIMITQIELLSEQKCLRAAFKLSQAAPAKLSPTSEQKWKFHSFVQNDFALPAGFLYFCIQEATKAHVSQWFPNQKELGVGKWRAALLQLQRGSCHRSP